ncbi:hypothetical protein [Streptomyces sp. NPDC002685]|uniref:hypothetical protein n=1 Tax=Streptomyces sp. NPDC002685 TaxID=3154540 RepID=UPI0033224DB6
MRSGELARPAQLTVREEQILRIIGLSIEGLTVAELGAVVGLRSKGSVAYRLRNPEECGALFRDGWNWRTCRLLSPTAYSLVIGSCT